MSVFYIILPLVVLLGGAAIVAYVWSVRSGQLDDLETPAARLLHEDAVRREVPKPGAATTSAGPDATSSPSVV